MLAVLFGERGVSGTCLPGPVIVQKCQRRMYCIIGSAMPNVLNLVTQLAFQWIIQKNLTPCESSCPKICAFPLLTSTLRAFCSRS